MQHAIRKERTVDAVHHMATAERPRTTAEPDVKVVAHQVVDRRPKREHRPQLNKSQSWAALQPHRVPEARTLLMARVVRTMATRSAAIGRKDLVAPRTASAVTQPPTVGMVAKVDHAQALRYSQRLVQSQRQRPLIPVPLRYFPAVSLMCKLVHKLCMQDLCRTGA